MPSLIDKLHEDFAAITSKLENDVSSHVTANEVFRKSLLLAAASYFEMQMTSEVENFVREASRGSLLLTSLAKNKAIKRQYHTWFDWDRDNANTFFKLFGEEFKNFMTAKLTEVDGLKQAISDFMELGRQRNKLVHENYASFDLDKTAEEIFGLYKSANSFVSGIPLYLRECHEQYTAVDTRN